MPLMESIQSQKGFKNLEIILINSGNDDLSSLKNSKLNYLEIDSKDFGHGKTRNLGLSHSKEEFVIFITDDAIPASDQLFFNMCSAFEKEEKVKRKVLFPIRLDDEIEKITHQNVLRLYRFDGLEKAGGREKCTVAALRELGADVDTREVSLDGIAPRGYAPGKVVTSEDILRR